MKEFKRDEFKNDPIISKIFKVLVENHQIGAETQQILFRNRHVKNFTVLSRHFIQLAGVETVFLHYDIFNKVDDDQNATVNLDSIIIYDDFDEYEFYRLKIIEYSKVHLN